MRHFYAISWRYGMGTYRAKSGTREATYHRFDTREERDEWVRGGNPYTNGRDAREAVPSTDRELRAKLRLAKSDAYLRSSSFAADVIGLTDAGIVLGSGTYE